MSNSEMLTKIEMLNQNTETLIVDRYIVRWVDVLSQRFDSTSFKRVYPELYQAYVKHVASRRFTISQ